MVAERKAEEEEQRYKDLQAVLQAKTCERQAVLDIQIREMSSERAELVIQACHGNMHDAYEHDWMTSANPLVQADVVSFGRESDTNISPCL